MAPPKKRLIGYAGRDDQRIEPVKPKLDGRRVARIKYLRDRKRLTVPQIAKTLGISEKAVNRYLEAGGPKNEEY